MLRQGYFSGAYYLAGYAVECGLKACIAKNTREYDFPPKVEFVRDLYKHDFAKLIKAAGLKPSYDDIQVNSKLAKNWSLVNKWSGESRYNNYDEKDAGAIFEAINEKEEGVLEWIKQHW